MTDLSTDIAQEPTSLPEDDEAKFFISFELKNGAGTLSVDTRKVVHDDQYREALRLGFKAMAERAMSKITKEAYPVEAERKAAIKARAEQNIQDVYDGTAKISGKSTTKKASGAVMTEAMRLARNLVKDAIKAAKGKISHYKASEITKAAKDLIADTPSIIVTAEANLAARAETPIKLNVMSLIKEDPELVKKAEAKKAEAKANKPLSKTQAGKVAPRARGSKPQAGANA